MAMKNTYKLFPKFLLLAGFALMGCQEVIELELPDNEPLLIVNGRLTNADSCTVEIATTAPYFSQAVPPPISDALVELFENGQWVATLDETSKPGVYKSAFSGTVGNNYHIKITLATPTGGIAAGIYESAPETMARIFAIDSIFIDSIPALPPFREAGRYPFFSFREPAGRGDYYRLRRWIDDSLLNRPQDLQVFNDDFADGRAFDNVDLEAIQFLGDLVESGRTYRIEVASISRQHWEFLNLIFQQTVQVGGTFDPPPAPIIGNMRKPDNPSAVVLGYFVVSAIVEDGVTAD
jgi:hypothetical protein